MDFKYLEIGGYTSAFQGCHCGLYVLAEYPMLPYFITIAKVWSKNVSNFK